MNKDTQILTHLLHAIIINAWLSSGTQVELAAYRAKTLENAFRFARVNGYLEGFTGEECDTVRQELTN